MVLAHPSVHVGFIQLHALTGVWPMVFNRPGVVGAVLHIALSFIHSFSQLVSLFLQIFKISNSKSKGAESLRECSPPTTCHMSYVMCHVSHIMCHISRVKYHVSNVTFFSLFFGQSVEVYWWRVCYQRGLPRLVSKFFESQNLTSQLIFVKSCLDVSLCFYGQNKSFFFTKSVSCLSQQS